MGWTFTYRQTLESLVKERISDRSWTNNKGRMDLKVLAHSKRGNNLWYAVELTQTLDEGTKIIQRYLALDILAMDRKSGAGYKDMSEEMGPYQYNCPLYLLDLVPEPIPSATTIEWNNSHHGGLSWRDRVRAFHAEGNKKRKEAAQYATGQRWELKSGLRSKSKTGTPLYSVRIINPNYTSRSVVGTCNDGKVYRIPKKYLVRELLGEKEVPAQQFMAEMA